MRNYGLEMSTVKIIEFINVFLTLVNVYLCAYWNIYLFIMNRNGGIFDRKRKIMDMKWEIMDSKGGIMDRKSEIMDSKSEIMDRK